jgi:hypothetical protein
MRHLKLLALTSRREELLRDLSKLADFGNKSRACGDFQARKD